MLCFKDLGATFIAHKGHGTHHAACPITRRWRGASTDFKKPRALIRTKVKLVPARPPVTFCRRKPPIRLGGPRGKNSSTSAPASRPGDTYVPLPPCPACCSRPAPFGKKSMPNMAFTARRSTPGSSNWGQGRRHGYRYDSSPPHGDRREHRADAKETRRHVGGRITATVKQAVEKRVAGRGKPSKTLTFPQYKDWRKLSPSRRRDQGAV